MSKKNARKNSTVVADVNATVVNESELNEVLNIVENNDSSASKTHSDTQNSESQSDSSNVDFSDSSASESESENLQVNFFTKLDLHSVKLKSQAQELTDIESDDSKRKLQNTVHRQKLLSIISKADAKVIDHMLSFARSSATLDYLVDPSNIYVAQDIYKASRYIVNNVQFATLSNALKALKSASRPLTVAELAQKMCNEITRARYVLRVLHYFNLAHITNAELTADNSIIKRASKDCTVQLNEEQYSKLFASK